MMNYEGDEHIISAAQSCKHMKSGGFRNSRVSTAGENVSCRICSNWNGDRCIINASDSIFRRMDQ